MLSSYMASALWNSCGDSSKMVVIRFALMTYHSDACLENGFEQDEVTGRDARQQQVGKVTRWWRKPVPQ